MKLQINDTIKIEHNYRHGIETFSEAKMYTVKKITAQGNFQVVDEFGTGCTIKPSIFDNPQVRITLI